MPVIDVPGIFDAGFRLEKKLGCPFTITWLPLGLTAGVIEARPEIVSLDCTAGRFREGPGILLGVVLELPGLSADDNLAEGFPLLPSLGRLRLIPATDPGVNELVFSILAPCSFLRPSPSSFKTTSSWREDASRMICFANAWKVSSPFSA